MILYVARAEFRVVGLAAFAALLSILMGGQVGGLYGDGDWIPQFFFNRTFSAAEAEYKLDIVIVM